MKPAEPTEETEPAEPAEPTAATESAAQRPRALEGRIALVAGATRGAGRAIARELGWAGAFVYCTGRSTAANPSDYARRETIEETAGLIRADGGQAEAVVVDHLDVGAVRNLVERIDREQGRLDILINDIGGEAYVGFGIPLWEYDLDAGMRLFDAGFRSHLLTSHAALGLLTRHPGGLVVETTDGTRAYNGGHFRETVFLDLTKTAVDRLAFAEGHELKAHGGAAVSVTPGWLRSEMMLDAFGVTEENWRQAAEANRGKPDAVPPYEFVVSETPALVARGIAALAADPERGQWNTRSVSSFDLAEHYGLRDLDGSRPDAWGFIEAMDETPSAEIDVGHYR